MISALIGGGSAPSATLRALAERLERDHPGHHVQVIDLDLRPAPTGRHPLDRAAAMIQELDPGLVGAACTPANVVAILDLCDRIHRAGPERVIALWGCEASARREELLGLACVDHVLSSDLVAALGRLMRGGLPAPTGPPPRLDPPPSGTSPYGARVEALLRSSRRLGAPVVVEPFDGESLSVDEADGLLRPLLRAGVAVRLWDPLLCGDPERLGRLLSRLSGSTGRLQLELPGTLLQEALVESLAAARPGSLRVDLTELAAARWNETGPLEAALERLGPTIDLRAALTYGHPDLDARAFGVAVDRCLRLGLEDLDLRRQTVPPFSALRGRQEEYDLRYATTPPYEVLSHHALTAAELLGLVRFCATYELLRAPLAGTGILRALTSNLGSAFEVIEGFAERLTSQGGDPLAGPPDRPVERLLTDHLREFHGIDLALDRGNVKLHRADTLSLRWLKGGRRMVTDEVTGRVAHLGARALTLIDRFDRPQTTFEVCERIVAEAPAEQRGKLRADLQLTVQKLEAMGFLLAAPRSRQAPGGEEPFTGLEEFDYHYRMLGDTARVDAYREAIERVVRPGMHVVEIGTGTGILAVLAARAGARVTAIEQYSLVQLAREVARQSGVEDRIEFVRGRSDLVQLEQRGDLLLSEIVGNRILNESLLEVTIDARERLLRPDAAMIPQRLEILAELGHTGRFAHLRREFADLGARYGIDLAPLNGWFTRRLELGRVLWELNQEEDDFEPLTAETAVIELELRRLTRPEFSRRVALTPLAAGPANAVVLAFRLQLQPGIELSTGGRRHGLHWSKPVFMLGAPVELAPDRPRTIEVSYETHGELRVALVPED